MSTNKPNPGSEEAVKMGCICPRSDNDYGHDDGGGLFWVNEDCVIHGRNNQYTAWINQESECPPCGQLGDTTEIVIIDVASSMEYKNFVQGKYLVHGLNDVLWTDSVDEALEFVRDQVKV